MASLRGTSFLLAAPFLIGCNAENSEGRCWPFVLSANKTAGRSPLIERQLAVSPFASDAILSPVHPEHETSHRTPPSHAFCESKLRSRPPVKTPVIQTGGRRSAGPGR